MKTAKEILVKYMGNDYSHEHRKDVINAMEEYASQFKYDYSQACRCTDSPGETWCCNLCGLPIDNESKSKNKSKPKTP